MNTQSNLQDKIQGPVFIIGIVLVFCGSISLIYLALSVVQVIQSPEQSGLVKWVVSTVDSNEFILSGRANENKFELHASSPFQYLFLGIMGLVMLSILTTVVNTLISGGIKLIMFSKQELDGQSDTMESNKRV